MLALGKLVIAAVLCCATATTVAQDSSQTYAEWSTETRTSLGFRVNAEAIRSLLPAGWSVAPATDAPDKVNVSMTFMDRHLVLDSQGQALGSGSSRYMVMTVQARNDASGQNSTLAINGISPEGSGSYEVYQQAVTARAVRLRDGEGESSGQIEENWEMVAESGDRVQLTLSYQPALPVRRQSSIVVRSGKNTGFTRTYRIDQASDALGLPEADRINTLEFHAQGPLFSRLFDGSEELTGVTSTPFYVREIYIP